MTTEKRVQLVKLAIDSVLRLLEAATPDERQAIAVEVSRLYPGNGKALWVRAELALEDADVE